MTTPAPDATTPATDDNDDVFTKAFDMLSAVHDKPDPASLTEAPVATPDPAVTPAPKPDAAPVADDQTNFETPPVAATETPATPPVAATEMPATPPVTPPVLGDDFADKLAQALARNQPKPEPAPQPRQELFAPEEAAFLTEYEKDYPDIARAEALRRRAENQLVVKHVFNEISKVVTPLQELVAQMLQDSQLAELHKVVPEYETKREDVIKWVDTQPTYLKIAYNHVIQNGTVEEVADLINRYSQATGTQNQQAPAQTPPSRTTELPAATKQAAASLAPVGSKRTAVVRGIAKDDFDGAFAEYAGQL